MGSEARQVLKLNISLRLTEEESEVPQTVISKMRDYYMGSKNVIFERFTFNKAAQGMTETIALWETRPCDLAKSCDYGALAEQLAWDRFIVGLHNEGLQQKLSLLYVWYSTTIACIGRWTAIAQMTSMRGTCGWTTVSLNLISNAEHPYRPGGFCNGSPAIHTR